MMGLIIDASSLQIYERIQLLDANQIIHAYDQKVDLGITYI